MSANDSNTETFRIVGLSTKKVIASGLSIEECEKMAADGTLAAELVRIGELDGTIVEAEEPKFKEVGE